MCSQIGNINVCVWLGVWTRRTPVKSAQNKKYARLLFSIFRPNLYGLLHSLHLMKVHVMPDNLTETGQDLDRPCTWTEFGQYVDNSRFTVQILSNHPSGSSTAFTKVPQFLYIIGHFCYLHNDELLQDIFSLGLKKTCKNAEGTGAILQDILALGPKCLVTRSWPNGTCGWYWKRCNSSSWIMNVDSFEIWINPALLGSCCSWDMVYWRL